MLQRFQTPKLLLTSGKQQAASLSVKKFARLKRKAYELRPAIGEIENTHGEMTFFEYAKQVNRENRNKIVKKRKPEIITTLKKPLLLCLAQLLQQVSKDNSKKMIMSPQLPTRLPCPTPTISTPYYKTHFRTLIAKTPSCKISLSLRAQMSHLIIHGFPKGMSFIALATMR